MKSARILFATLVLVMGCLSSCKQINDIDDRLDKVEAELAELNAAVAKLQDAWDKGKIIQAISRLPEGGENEG